MVTSYHEKHVRSAGIQAYHKQMQSHRSKAQLLQEAQLWQMEHTLLLSITVFTGASSPAGNLYCGNRLDRMSDSVLVLTVDEWEVRYLPCAEGTCSTMGGLSITQHISALSSCRYPCNTERVLLIPSGRDRNFRLGSAASCVC